MDFCYLGDLLSEGRRQLDSLPGRAASRQKGKCPSGRTLVGLRPAPHSRLDALPAAVTPAARHIFAACAKAEPGGTKGENRCPFYQQMRR